MSLKAEISGSESAIIPYPEDHYGYEGENRENHSHLHKQTLRQTFLFPVCSPGNTFALLI